MRPIDDPITQSEESALARLRAWQKVEQGRYYELDGDHITRTDQLVLGCVREEGNKLVVANSDDEPHTEDNPASLAEMVEAALKRWAELYGEGKP